MVRGIGIQGLEADGVQTRMMKTINVKRMTADSLLTMWTAVLVYIVLVVGAFMGGTHQQALMASLIGPMAFSLGALAGIIFKNRRKR